MKKWLFIGIIALQTLYLIMMAVSYYVIEDVGETVKLKTAPIDPSDIFYGDYVILNYEIERVPMNKWTGEDHPKRGEKIYVLLQEEEDGIYDIKMASNQRMDTSDDEVLVTARFKYIGVNELQVDYGIGRYYVEDNTGRQYEENREGMVVTVAIAPWGQKKVVELNTK